MACKMCGWNGRCQMIKADTPEELHTELFFWASDVLDEKGFCLVEEDPHPEDSCWAYESDEEEEEEDD